MQQLTDTGIKVLNIQKHGIRTEPTKNFRTFKQKIKIKAQKLYLWIAHNPIDK